LQDLNKFLAPYFVYNQMWLNIFMDDHNLRNITKVGRNISKHILNHTGENKSLQFLKKIIFYVMKIIVLKT
jgi:hypothetical protein